MPNTIEATSPATQSEGDAQAKSSARLGNVSEDQATMMLLANATKRKAARPAKAPEETATSAQPEESAADTTTEETAPSAEEAQAATSVPNQAQQDGEAEGQQTADTTTAEGEGDAASDGGDTDTVHSQTISFTPEQQALFNKRLGKEVAKTKAMKAQQEEMKAKLAELESKLAAQTGQGQATQSQQVAQNAPVIIDPSMPLSDVNDIAALGQRAQAAKDAIRYVEEVLDDPTKWHKITDPNNEDREIKVHKVGDQLYTEADLKRSMRTARITLEDHVPARNQYLMAREAATKQALLDFPFLANKQSPEYQMVQAAKNNPRLAAIAAQPDADWLLAAMVEGKKVLDARQAEAKKDGKGATKPKLPPAKPSPDQVATSASGAASRAPIGSAQRQALAQESEKLSRKGGIGPEDAAKLLLKRSQLRNSIR